MRMQKPEKMRHCCWGNLDYERALEELYHAYREENTLFVRSAYLDALAQMDVRQKLPELKEKLSELLSAEADEESRKHVQEEIRGLRRILIRYEGITRHTFDYRQTENKVLLLTNHSFRQVLQGQTGGKVHPLGVTVQTDDLLPLFQVRIYREMLFFVSPEGTGGAGGGESGTCPVGADACTLPEVSQPGGTILFPGGVQGGTFS